MRNYFKIAAYVVFVAGIVGISASTLFAYSSGPPEGRTGSPADSLKTCNDVGCHNSYALNSGTATFSIAVPSSYNLGETLNITVSFGSSTTAKHGFEMSALDANNNHAGTFKSVDGNTQTSNGNYIKHTSAGSSQSGNASWKVQWTAPSSEEQGPVTFYASGNEANGNSLPTEDYIYTTTAEVSQVAATPTATATLTPSPTVMVTPTPECEVKSMSVSPKKLPLKMGKDGVVTVTLEPDGNCSTQGKTVTTKLSTVSKKRVSVPGSVVTDADGKAKFTITAKDQAGNAKVTFVYESLKKFVTVKIRK